MQYVLPWRLQRATKRSKKLLCIMKTTSWGYYGHLVCSQMVSKNAVHFFDSAALQTCRMEVCIQDWELAWLVQTIVRSSWWPGLPLSVLVDVCPTGGQPWVIITACLLVLGWKEVTGWDKGGTLFSNKTWNPLRLLLLCKTGNYTTQDSVCKHTQFGMQFSFQEYTMDDACFLSTFNTNIVCDCRYLLPLW